MVAVKREVEEVQMVFDLDSLTDSKPSIETTVKTDPIAKARRDQAVIDAVHEVMGTKILSQFININKCNEEQYLAEYAKAKEILYHSQFRAEHTS